MHDQASTLRELKKFVDLSAPENPPSKEEFLASISRPCGFSTVILVSPEKIGYLLPPIQNWVGEILTSQKRAFLWDQGAFLSIGTLLQEVAEPMVPNFQPIETPTGPLMVFPRFSDFPKLFFKPEKDKIHFLKNLFRSLSSAGEFWITLRAEELSLYLPLLHSADLTGILVPEHQESVLRCYEAVKSVFLSGYFSPIFLLNFPGDFSRNVEFCSERIKIVARKFLSLDLPSVGMVLSDGPSSKNVHPVLHSLFDSIVANSRDFPYFFAEGLFYPKPGVTI